MEKQKMKRVDEVMAYSFTRDFLSPFVHVRFMNGNVNLTLDLYDVVVDPETMERLPGHAVKEEDYEGKRFRVTIEEIVLPGAADKARENFGEQGP